MTARTKDPVLEAIASSLADLQQPDLSGLPEAQVFRTMSDLLERPEQLDRLRTRIRALSNGMTRLEPADREEFQFLSKELGASYQRLVGLFTERLVIIGNSSPQFLFVPSK